VFRGLRVTQCLEESFCGVEKIEHFISGYGIKVTGYVIDGAFEEEIEGLTGCDVNRYVVSCMGIKGIGILVVVELYYGVLLSYCSFSLSLSSEAASTLSTSGGIIWLCKRGVNSIEVLHSC